MGWWWPPRCLLRCFAKRASFPGRKRSNNGLLRQFMKFAVVIGCSRNSAGRRSRKAKANLRQCSSVWESAWLWTRWPLVQPQPPSPDSLRSLIGGVAQCGRAPGSSPGGRWFNPSHRRLCLKTPGSCTDGRRWYNLQRHLTLSGLSQPKVATSAPFDDCSLRIASLQATWRALPGKPLFFSTVPILFVFASKLTGTFVFHDLWLSPPWSC